MECPSCALTGSCTNWLALLERIKSKRPTTLDPAIRKISKFRLPQEPKGHAHLVQAIRPVADNQVGFLVGRTHHGKDTIHGPNGLRVTKVIFEDGSSQDL